MKPTPWVITIMEGRTAICFTESTVETLHEVFKTKQHGMRYRPFGIMMLKMIVYGCGGLPVIYQPKKDYELLHETKKHLHVTYQLNSSDNADFTWEREWRLPWERLGLDPLLVRILVPSHDVRNLIGRLLTEGDDPPGDPWQHLVLEDLDVKVPLVAGETP